MRVDKRGEGYSGYSVKREARLLKRRKVGQAGNARERSLRFGICAQAVPPGQTMIEFSFCMIIIVILLYGMIKVFVWSGKDLAARRQAHEAILTNENLNADQQIRPVFFYATRFNAAVDSNVYGR